MGIGLMVLIGAVGLGLLIILGIYNGLVAKKNAVENTFGGIDAQLKKRYDLIPNLISAVKNYMQHERDTLEKLTELRSRAVSGTLNSDEKVVLDNQITQSVKGLMVAVENYPDLKANENFMQLQRSLNEVESQISAARRAFNATVTEYNNGVEMFPSSIIAGMMRYKRKQVFEITQAERQNVNVGDMFKA
ncbi:LemA family protein [bacterium]|nr:LemA family protein [bacterium]